MLRWAIIFLVLTIVAAAFGFGHIAVGAAEVGKILFYIFLIIFLVSSITGLARR